jgi:hypothetical protein
LLKEPKTVNPMGMKVAQLGLAKILGWGATVNSKENDSISAKISHARSSLTTTHIAFGGMETASRVNNISPPPHINKLI